MSQPQLKLSPESDAAPEPGDYGAEEVAVVGVPVVAEASVTDGGVTVEVEVEVDVEVEVEVEEEVDAGAVVVVVVVVVVVDGGDVIVASP